MVELSEELFCVSEDAEGFFVADGVLDAEGVCVVPGALDAVGVSEVPGLLDEAGVSEVPGLLDEAGASDAASFFGMISPCWRTFLHAVQIVSPVYPSSVAVASFLFTTSLLT